jgi:CRP/FNR family cyclic AMP-dependent transcriptional regulator
MRRGESATIDLSRLDTILFRNLPPEQLRDFGALVHRKTFSANVTLMTADQAGEAVYIILDGTVKVHIEQEDGTDVIIAILGPGEIVGEMSALGQPSRSASVVTVEDSEFLWVDRADFQRCLLTMPVLTYNLACILSNRLRYANEKIQLLAAQSVESRVARQILSFAEQYGRGQPNGDIEVAIRLTQTDIASLIGASRERINKVMVSYKERGYLSVGRDHRITIHNRKALAKRSGSALFGGM